MVIIRMDMDVARIWWDIHATNNGMWFFVSGDSYPRYGLIQFITSCVWRLKKVIPSDCLYGIW
jgi:hypothetical protein